MKRVGNTLTMEHTPWVESCGAVCGKKEGDGPLGHRFDRVFEDITLEEDTWEQSESALQKEAVSSALHKGGLTTEDMDCVFAGDLLNQCAASSFALRDTGIPFLGQYAACATIGQGLLMAAVFAECGASQRSLAVTSSHFCAAERQFRLPLEYGGQRTPTSQWTSTASGAVVVSSEDTVPILPRKTKRKVKIRKVTIGRIRDLGVKDMNNMGAAMAPAAAETLLSFFRDTGTLPDDYDRIFTGDLGEIGTQLFYTLTKDAGISVEQRHSDCGLLLYDRGKQDVHAGGSGCGCASSVLCAEILPQMERGEMQSVLFLPTGALLSQTSAMQGETSPAVSHLIHFAAE